MNLTCRPGRDFSLSDPAKSLITASSHRPRLAGQSSSCQRAAEQQLSLCLAAPVRGQRLLTVHGRLLIQRSLLRRGRVAERARRGQNAHLCRPQRPWGATMCRFLMCEIWNCTLNEKSQQISHPALGYISTLHGMTDSMTVHPCRPCTISGRQELKAMLGKRSVVEQRGTCMILCSGRSQGASGGTSGPQRRRRSSLYSHWFTGSLAAWRRGAR